MAPTTRRTVLRALGSIPIIGAVAKVGLFGLNIGESTPETRQSRQMAVKILRFLNTAESRHRSVVGSYCDLADLGTSKSIAAWLDSEKAEKLGLGRTFFSTLNFGAVELVPGMQLRFRLRSDGLGYVASIHHVTDAEMGAFSTDQVGVIYHGDSTVPFDPDKEFRAGSSLLVGAAPIGSNDRPQGIVASIFRALAVGTVVYADNCCQDYPCSCGGSCTACCVGSAQTCCPNNNCGSNCGCVGCYWCIA